MIARFNDYIGLGSCIFSTVDLLDVLSGLDHLELGYYSSTPNVLGEYNLVSCV
jgi:hypothetical protein